LARLTVQLFVMMSLALAPSGCRPAANEVVPAGYPRSYADVIRQARVEGHLLIWSAVDSKKAQPLVAAFRRHYPFLGVDFIEISGAGLNKLFLDRADKGQPTADLLWSSAMDLQIKLANDGYAASYASPERARLPDWANWKDQAWGTTAEPIVWLYNRKLIDPAAVPRSHVALSQLLESRPPGLAGRVATYDLPRSAVGYLYLGQDQQASHDSWRMVQAMGVNGVRLFANAEDIVRDVIQGHSAIGYNIVGSYALEQVGRHQDLGIVFPRDYTLLMSRIAIITRTARNPAAAKLFLDFLLSREGQSYLVAARMPSVRRDLPRPVGLDPSEVPMRAIRVGPALLIDQDQLTRRYLLSRWTEAIAPTPKPRISAD
jgi:iron(III) transport system substrate-binding protein